MITFFPQQDTSQEIHPKISRSLSQAVIEFRHPAMIEHRLDHHGTIVCFILPDSEGCVSMPVYGYRMAVQANIVQGVFRQKCWGHFRQVNMDYGQIPFFLWRFPFQDSAMEIGRGNRPYRPTENIASREPEQNGIIHV